MQAHLCRRKLLRAGITVATFIISNLTCIRFNLKGLRQVYLGASLRHCSRSSASFAGIGYCHSSTKNRSR
jgi:hypothetical protein